MPTEDTLLPLVEVAERSALAWVTDRLEYFNPLHYTEVRKVNFALKASAELALLCDLACSNPRSPVANEYRDIAHYLFSDIFSDRAVRDHLLTTEMGLLTFGLYAALRQCGYDDLEYRGRLKLLLDQGYVYATEHVPARELDF